eukprot:6195417-Pleurochrysis_carterae.AAC.2
MSKKPAKTPPHFAAWMMATMVLVVVMAVSWRRWRWFRKAVASSLVSLLYVLHPLLLPNALGCLGGA